MIKIREHEIKNSIEEFTIGEFEELSKIINDLGLDYVEKQLKIFNHLGVPNDVLDDLSIPEFKQAVQDYNSIEPKDYSKPLQEIELGGYTYRAFEDEFIFTAKDLSLIEKKIKKNELYISYAMAVIFKRTDLSKVEHYDNAHLKLKEKLFKDVKAVHAVYYLSEIGKAVNNVAENTVNEEVVE